MRSKLVTGNWKSNGELVANRRLLEQVRASAGALRGVEAAVCVPFTYLAQAQQILGDSSVAWGGQDVSQFGAGAYTGAVTATMLTDFGCKYAIVGHSERRAIFGDSDAIVAAEIAEPVEDAAPLLAPVAMRHEHGPMPALTQPGDRQEDLLLSSAPGPRGVDVESEHSSQSFANFRPT